MFNISGLVLNIILLVLNISKTLFINMFLLFNIHVVNGKNNTFYTYILIIIKNMLKIYPTTSPYKSNSVASLIRTL